VLLKVVYQGCQSTDFEVFRGAHCSDGGCCYWVLGRSVRRAAPRYLNVGSVCNHNIEMGRATAYHRPLHSRFKLPDAKAQNREV
jgi:hypothetical protein